MRLLKKLFLLLTLLLVCICSAFAWWAHTPIHKGSQPIDFEIRPGGVQSVISQLRRQGVAVNDLLFTALIRLTGNTRTLKAGYYEIKPGETPSDLLERLAKGLVAYESITIVEGWTFRQMKQAIDSHPYLKHETLHLTERELMEQLKITYGALEGLFFPDTYLFTKNSSDLQLYRQAHLQLMKKLYSYWEKRDESLPYKTPYEALIMASIVEKETGMEADRGKVAGVFTNRLKIGMKLQTDPTVIYGMGDKYKGVIYKSSLTTDTPYNTYTRSGLPPTPIALVGEAAIRATFEPEPTDALYFVARGDGSSEFTSNLDDHNRAVNKFLRNNGK